MSTMIGVIAGVESRSARVARLGTVGERLSRWALQMPDAPAHTFRDYLSGSGRTVVTRSVTWAELDRWTRITAALLGRLANPGDRVAILAPSGPEYVVGFAAALRAGLVAVPLFPPDHRTHGDRLEAVLEDCTPSVVITTSAEYDGVVESLARRGLPVAAVLCPDDLVGPECDALAEGFTDADVDLDDLAYLQYTSGSTRSPAGVELTHRNLVVNAHQIMVGQGVDFGDVTCVSWLPLFHDMGLMLGAAAPLLLGLHAVVMDPRAFVLAPARWLRELGQHPNTITAAPNFAYDLAARRVTAGDLEGCDLGQVIAMLNGAEPVQPATVERFVATFAPLGLDPGVHTPSYGLAEAVVCVTMTPRGEAPTVLAVDGDALQAGRLVPAEDPDGDRVVRVVSSGVPASQLVVIVDPATGRPRADGEVGEIWIHGPHVARGYWGDRESSGATFGGELADTGDGLPASPWLRTGDLGALDGGRLVVTGRLKDLIIVDGRNIYPQDVEVAVAAAHRAIARNRLAAFSVPHAGGEAVVVVAERHCPKREAAGLLAEVEGAARAAASARQGVALHDFVLVEPNTIPWTTSGKVARRSTRAAYLDGSLRRVGPAPRER